MCPRAVEHEVHDLFEYCTSSFHEQYCTAFVLDVLSAVLNTTTRLYCSKITDVVLPYIKEIGVKCIEYSRHVKQRTTQRKLTFCQSAPAKQPADCTNPLSCLYDLWFSGGVRSHSLVGCWLSPGRD